MRDPDGGAQASANGADPSPYHGAVLAQDYQSAHIFKRG